VAFFLVVLVCSAPLARAADPADKISLTVTIRDADSGQPVAARVHVKDEKGGWHSTTIRSTEPKGTVVPYVRRFRDSVENHVTVSAHPFTINVPAGKYTILVERGKEYHPLTQEVTIAKDSPALELKLRRWIDMPARGWYSGDTHVHRPWEEVQSVMLAEDLNVAFPLSYWVQEAYESPAKSAKRRDEPGRLVEVDKTHVIYPRNTEYEIFTVKKANHMLGAVFVLNQQTVYDQGVPPIKPIAERAHKEGALLEMDKHNWPWTMIIVPVMKTDLYELANNHCWRTDFGIKDWAERDAPYMKVERDARGWTEWGWIDYGFQNYYALLNCGFRLKPTGGTASGVHPVPLGFGRVYVKLSDGFSYDAWLKGLAAGRSFVTTGPMLFVEVDGQPPGHRFEEKEAREFAIKGEAVSGQPLGRIEVLVNGEIVRTIKPESRKQPNGSFQSAIAEKVKIDGSSWIAVRCFEDRPDKRIRFAHSAPVWIDVAGKPLRPRKEELDWLVKRCEDQLKRSAEVLPKEVLDEYREAVQFYKAIEPRK
jgi:hypothetical protein